MDFCQPDSARDTWVFSRLKVIGIAATSNFSYNSPNIHVIQYADAQTLNYELVANPKFSNHHFQVTIQASKSEPGRGGQDPNVEYIGACSNI